MDRPGAAPSTLWSVVLAAGRGAPEALESLADRYSGPIYATIRRSGHPVEAAQDLTQDFLVFLLESNVLGRADPTRGSFRSYLFTCLRNFLSDRRDRAGAARRGGDRVHLSLDVEGAEEVLDLMTEAEDPHREFDRCWALETVARSLNRLRGEISATAAEIFDLVHASDPPSHRELARRFDRSENAIAASIHRTRKKLRDILRAEVGQTVASPDRVDEELASLLSCFSSRDSS